MPYKCKKKQQAYQKAWRKRHPKYMTEYGRKYRKL